MLVLKDTLKLAETVSDGYSDSEVSVLTDIDALFLQSTSKSHSNHVDVISSDAHAYLDPTNPVLIARGYRIEGLYIIATPFGTAVAESWYKITRVVIGQRKLLANDIDNVHVFLQKVVAKESNV